MKRYVVACLLGTVSLAAIAAPAPTTTAANWHVLQRWQIGGDGGWDYLAFDPAAKHLYVSRSDRVVVMDVGTGKQIGEVDGLSGVHGIAIANDLHRGFISNGRANTVTVFDPATLKTEQTIAVKGENPDAILYDPYSKRVFTFNGHSKDASVIDATSGKLLGTIALPGKPEFAVSDGQGHVYDNIEDKGELVEIDPKAMKVTHTWELKNCEDPSGLAMDIAHRRLFSVCQNKNMAVTDADTGKPVASVPIGDGPDAAAFDPQRQLAFSSNGESGTLTVVHEDNADKYSVLANVPTQKSARTMALQPNGDIYLSAAQFGARPKPSADNPRGRPPLVAGSFTILVVGSK
ncbi:MAG TPA: YncE family protein [Rhodanobacteraceae bacterium]|nr:YncE family protein [Rhodanobacteraceae bacterium]